MYDTRPNLIIGFHGCDQAVADQLLTTPDTIKSARKLMIGSGMVFIAGKTTQQGRSCGRKTRKHVAELRNRQSLVRLSTCRDAATCWTPITFKCWQVIMRV